MVKNIKSLQLLRNGNVFNSYTAAVAGITGTPTDDGVIKLARYTYTPHEEGSGDTKYVTTTVKTVFGICHNPNNVTDGTTGYTYTIFDSYHEVIADLQRQIDAMGGDSGSIAEQIKAAIDQLNYTGVTTGDGVVVTNVTESSGVVSATSAEVGGLKLTNYTKGSDSGAVVATDSINAAISKLENQVDAVKAEKDAAIDALDVEDTAVSGQYVSQVTETDGKIAVARVELPSLTEVHEAGKPIIAVSEDKGQLAASAGTINAEFVNVADGGNLFTGSTVEAVLAEIDAAYKAADAAIVGDATISGNTLGKLEDRIEALDADAKEYHIVKTTDGLPETIKERYSLVDAAGNVSGDTVDIPKDSHIVSITYDGATQKLTYTYINDSGVTASTDVDMSQLVLETEFGSGVTVTDHVAHGVVDPTSESFLTVGENGFKLAGVSGLVENQIAALDASVTGGTAAGTATSNHVQVIVDEVDGKLTAVTVNEANIASKSDLDALSGKTVTGVEMTGGTANIVNNDTDGTKKITINADGSTLKTSTAYTSAQTASAVETGDSIDTALGKLEAQVAAAKTAATTKVVEGTDTAGVMTIDENVADSGNTYTIKLSNIAKADAVGLNANGSHVTTQGAYTSEATTIAGEIAALDAALNTVSGKVDNAQAEIDRMESAIGLKEDGTYSANTTNNYTSDATSVNGAIDALDDAVKANADAIAANKVVSANSALTVTSAATGTTLTVVVDDKAHTVDSSTLAVTDTKNADVVSPIAITSSGIAFADVLDAGFYD